jgi:DNA-binding response OmpR family regulator
MPGVTGLELAQMIKARKKTAYVPIIFLTVYYDDDQQIIEGYERGAVDYVAKPVNPVLLRSKVGIFAQLYRKQRNLEEVNRALAAVVEFSHAASVVHLGFRYCGETRRVSRCSTSFGHGRNLKACPRAASRRSSIRANLNVPEIGPLQWRQAVLAVRLYLSGTLSAYSKRPALQSKNMTD